MGNKTFGRWNGHKLLEMADAESWEMVVIITTVYFCWAVCWKICGERRTLEMRVKNLIDARLLIKVIIFGWYLFARGPQRLFPKKKQIVCAAHLFRPLQPFQSSYVDLSGPCGGDGGVTGQKSLDHHLPTHTHWCSLLGLGDGDENCLPSRAGCVLTVALELPIFLEECQGKTKTFFVQMEDMETYNSTKPDRELGKTIAAHSAPPSVQTSPNFKSCNQSYRFSQIDVSISVDLF